MAARKPARRSARRRPVPRPKAKALRRAKPAGRSRAKAAGKSPGPRRVTAKTAKRRVVRTTRKVAPVKSKPVIVRSRATARSKAAASKSTATVGKSLSLKKKAAPPRVTSRPAPAPVAAKSRPARPAPPPNAPKAASHHPAHPPTLSRERRRLSDLDLLDDEPRIPSEVDLRAEAAAHSGGVELQHAIERHTEAGPSLTAGDLDARWADAYAVGDEAPGGDNPTPDQDRVDDIGKALGVVYREGEELQGSDKIAERDAHRWELDPASSDDWPHKP